MTMWLLGAVILAGLAGPLLRIPKQLSLPVAIGELLIGGILGHSGFNKIPTSDQTLTLLATVGFALLMFTAGSHINYRTFTKKSLGAVAQILVLNAMVAAALGYGIDKVAHFSHWQLLAIIAFSSSAAFVIPIVALATSQPSIEVLIAQVTIADALSFFALPFFTQPAHQLQAVEGALIVLAVAIVLYFVLRWAKARGYLDRTHELSKDDHLGLELRISLALLLLVAALALRFHSSVMVAGFSLGVALASIGVPHRLARQLFAVSDGLFAPIYFVWLGASINIRNTFHSRDALLLALLLFSAAIVAHLPALFFKQSFKNVLLASGELGIPAAAVTLGTANGVLTAAQAGALMLAAIGTLLVASTQRYS